VVLLARKMDPLKSKDALVHKRELLSSVGPFSHWMEEREGAGSRPKKNAW
jgi:hypothetical protein